MQIYPIITKETEHLFLSPDLYEPLIVNQDMVSNNATAPIEAGRSMNLLKMSLDDALLSNRAQVSRVISVADVVLRVGKDTLSFNVQGQPGAEFTAETVDDAVLNVNMPLVLSVREGTICTNEQPLRTLIIPKDGAVVILGQLTGSVNLESGIAQFQIQLTGTRVLQGGKRIECAVTERDVLQSKDHYLTLIMHTLHP